jgi:hypothetical protein
MWDVLHIFIFYLIQPIESENVMKVSDYSVEGIIASFRMCKYEERPLSQVWLLRNFSTNPLHTT